MRRFLRLLALCLFALALPLQGALAASAMASTHPRMMTMPDGRAMAAAMPCHDHAVDS